MKNIHILQKSSFNQLGVDHYGKTPTQIKIAEFLINKNIYITSDEEIKEGDWHFKNDKMVTKSHLIDNTCKKIILTTDQDLIKDGIQAIDDGFLEWFIKNPSCEEVKIESWQTKGEWDLDYKIIIPKEEPEFIQINQDNPVTRGSTALVRNPKYQREMKQETLEEVAEILYPYDGVNEDYKIDSKRWSFISGAEWQQERMYSEEDMRLAINKARDISDGKDCFDAEDISGCTEVCTYGWKFNMSEDSIIEQFKRK